MATFTQRMVSSDHIDVPVARIEEVLADPDLLAELTPLVASLKVDGDRWLWSLVKVSALGMSVQITLTTVMDIQPGRLDFRPDPEAEDIAAATGRLILRTDSQGWAEVDLDLVAQVDLPLPAFMGGAVRSVMSRAIKVGGGRFADNLLAHLGHPRNRGIITRPVDGDHVADERLDQS